MTKIQFGTDGWRAIIADEYTVENLKRVAEGTAKWVQQKGGEQVLIGHDTRFAGPLFAEMAARVIGAHGLKVQLAKGFVSTPMVSLGVVKTGSYVGVVITASHNPPSYNGFKLKSKLGGPMIPAEVTEVESLIPDTSSFDNPPTLEELEAKGLLTYVDLESMYLEHVHANFDVEAIRNASFKIAYDAMYGAGQRVVQKLLPNAVTLHCDENPGFKSQAPEPIERNLRELEQLIKSDPSIDVGFANDGDADRIGMYDGDAKFVDSHHILLLLLLYMHDYKKQSGKVVITFSVTDKMKKLAELYGLDVEVTKIGFKYIAEIMGEENVIVGGEESGGLAVSGHIPERDGVWIALLVLEFMAKTGKTLKQLVQDIYDKVGAFSFDRYDLHVSEEQKQKVISTYKNNPYKEFGPYKVSSSEFTDGAKFHLGAGQWVLIRPSGTEPVLRVYAQADTHEEVINILEATKAVVTA